MKKLATVRLMLGVLLVTPATAYQHAVSQTTVNVLTAHNDIGRTGQNLQETVLTPANVTPVTFGKLFSQPILGSVYAQPLYVSQLAIPGNGTHNVVFVATTADYVYAFDADDNGGIDGPPLWQTNLLSSTTPSGAFQNQFGVVGTPVIDLSSKTIYLVSGELNSQVTKATGVTTYAYRLHGLDITTGQEKFGGPVTIQGTAPGTGNGSKNGVLTFDPLYQYQRSGLLFLNGIVYLAFASINDAGPYHGWLFSYKGSTLQQIATFLPVANGTGGGIWMGGAGLAAEVNNGNQPYGRMFIAVGNGSFNATTPYTNAMSYGMSVINLDLTGGNFTVKDSFTPFDEAASNAQDGDLGSGGPILLPPQTLSSGSTLNGLVEIGKTGTIYLMDRNALGGFNSSSNQIVQQVQTPQSGGTKNWGAGVWGTSAYWNGNLYFEGTNWGQANPLLAYSLQSGVLSQTPTSKGGDNSFYPGPTPAISANGNSQGIVWTLKTDTNGPAVLFAYDATNLTKALYYSSKNASRDNPGAGSNYAVPTIVNGKVYIGTSGSLAVYGLLANTPTAATPVISPAGGSFSGSETVTITDSTSGAQIYYTTDGSTPTIYSTPYTGPLTVGASQTITAIASSTDYLQSGAAQAIFSAAANTANPVFSLSSGSYTGSQTLTISDATSGATIYYTTNGTTPTINSTVYTGAIQIQSSSTVEALATSSGLGNSSVVSANYTIGVDYNINFPNGFTQAQSSGQMQFNGTTALDDFRLQLTDGGLNERASAFYTTPMNIQAFTTTFTFQLSNPLADGMTFTVQNAGVTAVGLSGSSLGYGNMKKSVAVKFDLHNNSGEGVNSTGIYTNGAKPTVPSTSLVGTGIDLHSGDYMNAQITYDGTTLTLTLTDAVTQATWSQPFTVNIPSAVGATTAYVGFTAGTGGTSASQKVTAWTYLVGQPASPVKKK